MTSIGISLGASVLANWAARKGSENKMDAMVGLCCHFEVKKAYEFLSSHMFGIYDFVLAMGIVSAVAQSFEQFD
jgi:predicted alpha/beta-fold hydrolase